MKVTLAAPLRCGKVLLIVGAMTRSPLYQRTLELLRKSPATLREISEETALGYEWLRKFKAEKIPDPSVNRVQQLHDFLSTRRR